MAEHKPQGDRYFQVKNQQAEIRERGKMSSILGMSEFKSIEDLRECQKQLTLYFAQKEDPQKAADRASWMIKAEKQGERSPFVEDFLNGLPIGSWCKKEWEVAPGKVAPIFRSYLRFKLRRGEDTFEQVNQNINWFLKSSESLEDCWNECKRLIAIEKPRLMKAAELGQNPLSLNIPQWIIDIYRPETTIKEAADTAQTLGAIAIEQVASLKSQVSSLKPENEIPITVPGGITANTKIADLKCRYEEVLKQMPSSECASSLSLEQEIDELLADPITRTRGVMLAKKHDLPVILNEEGVAIAIDYVGLEDKRKREKVDEVMDDLVKSEVILKSEVAKDFVT